MASVNKVIIIGNLGQNPEKRITGTGQSVTTFSVATNERWLDKGGQKQERTEWHRIVVWGTQGDNCAQYLSKGRPVYVEGRLQTREWNDKDGNKRHTTEIVAQKVQFLGSNPSQSDRQQDSSATNTDQTPELDMTNGTGSDIPF